MIASRNLLLLGAGASYGSELETSIVPPLAATLFDDLSDFEPGVWGALPDEVKTAFRSNFEHGVLALAERSPHILPIAQRTMAAFFFRYGITKDSLYVRLGKAISESKWTGVISTLNYERMLLMGLGVAGLSVTCGTDNVKLPQIEAVFPHGCCHLFCESVRGSAGAVSFAGMNVTTNGPVVAVDRSLEFWQRIKLDAFPPVMSYFEPTKFTTSGASFITNQRERLSLLINSAKSIAIVGVNVREEDAYIWDCLAKTPAQIYYCSGKQASISFRDWQSRKRKALQSNDTVSEAFWKESFDAICDHLGFS